MSLSRILHGVLCPDQGVALIPFAFKANGTSDPTTIKGDVVSTVVYNSAGKWTVTLSELVYDVICVLPSVPEHSSDSVDIYTEITALATVASTGTAAKTLVVRTKTGSTNTAPPTEAWIAGVIVAKLVDR
jgi:hypothetical protein